MCKKSTNVQSTRNLTNGECICTPLLHALTADEQRAEAHTA